MSRRTLVSMPSGLLRYSTGSFPLRKRTPWCLDGRKPLPQSRDDQRLAAFVLGDHDDERRQVFVLGPQSVAQPGAHAGPAGKLRAGLHVRDGRAMVDGLGVHALDEAQVVGNLGRVRQQIAQPGAALAVLLKLERRTDQRQARLVARHAGQTLLAANFGRQLGTVLFVQQRLVIEQVDLRRPAGLKQKNDPLGFRREVRPLRRGGGRLRLQQLRQGDAAQAQAKAAQEVTPVV